MRTKTRKLNRLRGDIMAKVGGGSGSSSFGVLDVLTFETHGYFRRDGISHFDNFSAPIVCMGHLLGPVYMAPDVRVFRNR